LLETRIGRGGPMPAAPEDCTRAASFVTMLSGLLGLLCVASARGGNERFFQFPPPGSRRWPSLIQVCEHANWSGPHESGSRRRRCEQVDL